MDIKKYIPNILSTTRLFMAAALPFIFLYTNMLTALIFFCIGDITDAVDGFLARKWEVQSKYGKIIDPIADKTFNGLTLIMTSLIVNPLMFSLLGLEGIIAGISLLRVKFHRQKINSEVTENGAKKLQNNFMALFNRVASSMNVSKVGKAKTVSLVATTFLVLLSQLIPALTVLSEVLVAVTAALQCGTAIIYSYQFLEEKSDFKLVESKTSPIDLNNDDNDDNEKSKDEKRIREQYNIEKTTKPNQIIGNEINIFSTEELSSDEKLYYEEPGISRTLK